MLLQIGRRTEPDSLLELLLACHERIRGFSKIALALGERSDLPRAEVVEACERCIRYFAEALPLHVRDEEQSLLPRLRGRSPELDQAVHAMEREHHEHEPRLDALLEALRVLRDAPDSAAARTALGLAADASVPELERHLVAEETQIFPALALLPRTVELEAIAELRACGRRADARRRSTRITASLEALMKSWSRLSFLLLPASLAFGPACSCAGDSADGSGGGSTENGSSSTSGTGGSSSSGFVDGEYVSIEIEPARRRSS
jgi:hemerythrin-like domain-containing protein